MNKIRILIADDDEIFLRLVSALLHKAGYEVHQAENTEQALLALSRVNLDILMLDMNFPSLQDGFDLLQEVHANYPRLEVLMVSGSGHIPDAVQAMKLGASDFIEKPLEPEHLLLRIAKLGERLLSERNLHRLAKSAIAMVGVSAAMQKVFDSIIHAAGFDTPVLITGETGVGKELAAQAIHRLSRFGDKTMLSINCASVPKDLFEAELFGYEKGAFTDAQGSRKGYFEYAENTSFFLDEISELPLALQPKLLRVISEGEMQKVGGKILKVNTRLISATNQNLKAAVEEGRFRQDLFYRLHGIHIEIPPLRQRPEDIPALAQHFITQFCSANNIIPKSLSPEALAFLTSQPWRGNARELKNCLEKGVIFTKSDVLDVVDFTMIPAKAAQPCLEGSQSSLREAIHQFEKEYIQQNLQACDFSISRTAKCLGMDKSNLAKKITSLGILLRK